METVREEDEEVSVYNEKISENNLSDSGFDDLGSEASVLKGDASFPFEEVSAEPATLIELPDSVLQIVFANLSLADFERLSNTNEALNEILIDNLAHRFPEEDVFPFLKLTSTWTRDERPELVLEIYEEEESRVLVGPVTVNHNDNSTQNAVSVFSRALDTVVPRGLQRGKRLHVDIVGGADHYMMSVFETLFTDGGIAARCVTARRLHRFINLQRLNNVFKKAHEVRLEARRFYGTPWSRDLVWRHLVFEDVSFAQYASHLAEDALTAPPYKAHRVTLLMDPDEARAVRRNTDFAHFVPATQNETTTLALEFRKTSIRPAQSFEYKDPFMELEEEQLRSRSRRATPAAQRRAHFSRSVTVL